MNQKNEDAQAIAAECILQSEVVSYERGLFRRAGELIQQTVGDEASMFKTRCQQWQSAMEAELESVGAGGAQPLRAVAGWVLVPVEPTKEMLEAGAEDLRIRGLPMALLVSASECYRAMLAATPKAPKQAAQEPVAWRISCPDEPDLGTWLSEEPGGPGCHSEPLYTAPQQETPAVRALQSAILSGLSHEELLEKAHHLMTLTVNQARTIGELQEAAAAAAAAEAAPQQPVPSQKPKLRVGQVWRTRGGDVAEIVSETPHTPYPFRCVTDKGGWTVKKDGRYNAHEADTPDDLIELITDVQKGGEA